MKRLVLLGAGPAHLCVLRAFAAARPASAEVVLVSPSRHWTCWGRVPGLVAGHHRLAECQVPLRPLADVAGVQVVEGEAIAVDAAQRRVTLADGRTLEGDALSLDVDAMLPRDLLPGAREHALSVRPIDRFVALLEPMWTLAARQALDVVVIGGGAAAVELVLAFEHRLSASGGPAHRCSLVTGSDGLLAGHADRVAEHARQVLRRQRIAVIPQPALAVQADHVALPGGGRVACSAPILALDGRLPAWLAGSGLALSASGRVRTGATLQSTSHPAVFAAGDVATQDDAPHPRGEVQGKRAGPVLAHNLRAWLAGGTLRSHRPRGRTLTLLACGRQEAIAAWGPLVARGRWAWQWKDRIDAAFVARQRLT